MIQVEYPHWAGALQCIKSILGEPVANAEGGMLHVRIVGGARYRECSTRTWPDFQQFAREADELRGLGLLGQVVLESSRDDEDQESLDAAVAALHGQSGDGHVFVGSKRLRPAGMLCKLHLYIARMP